MKYSTFCESLLYIKIAKLALSESLFQQSWSKRKSFKASAYWRERSFHRAVLALHLGREVGCQLWCVLQQDIVAYRLCNPFIVEFIYFFGHMDGGLNTNVIMLTEAEKSPVSLKPLWLQLTSVVKLRELFLCWPFVQGFLFLACLFLLLVLHKNHLRKPSKPEDNFFQCRF